MNLCAYEFCAYEFSAYGGVWLHVNYFLKIAAL